jgi:hypothetical protein
MGRQSNHHRDTHQRILVAQTAARLMAEGGVRDFATAKRKAAERLGIHHSRNLPGNDEIEAALREYQQLFQHDSHEQHLRELRRTALQAMKLLSPFSPRLVGPVLNGTADQYSPVYLHLFADTAEEVGIFLMHHKIPFEQAERRVHYAGGREEQRPLYRFMAGDHALELTVFPPNGLRQSPLSPVDGRAMQRASREELQRLMDDEALNV